MDQTDLHLMRIIAFLEAQDQLLQGLHDAKIGWGRGFADALFNVLNRTRSS